MPLTPLVLISLVSTARAATPSFPPLRRCPLPPHAGYHGGTAVPFRSFFEGWYLRVTPPEDDTSWDGGSLAFVHHVFDEHDPFSPRRGAGIQVLTPFGMVIQEERDLTGFTANGHRLDVRHDFRGEGRGEGPGDFFELTEKHAKGRVTNGSLKLEYDFDLLPLIGWGGGADDRQYATAGWLSALPLFEPHYQVLVSHGKATGHISICDSGEEKHWYNLDNAVIYLEKNWGGSFPSRWWWIQANTFPSTQSLCVTSTGAVRKLPLTGQEEEVALIALHWEGKFLPFSDVTWSVEWGQWVIRGVHENYIVSLLGSCDADDKQHFVRCPTLSGMQERALENYKGTLRIVLQRREMVLGGMLETVLDTTTNKACLEVGGVPWKANEWTGRSAMVEPFKSIVTNVELERAGADMLQIMKNFVEIPGL